MATPESSFSAARPGRKRIGEFLVDQGVLTPEDVEAILKYARRSGLRFGEAGMEMGLLKRDALIKVFGPSYATDFFFLDPRYFPAVTRDVLAVSELLRLGVVPLAFKTEYKRFRARKRLNLGMLDPADKAAASEAERLARARLGEKGFAGLKFFLVLADQFLDVIRQVYGVSAEELRKLPPDAIHERLQMFLESGASR